MGPWPFVLGTTLLRWSKGRGIYGEGFGHLADRSRVDVGRAVRFDPPHRVAVDARPVGEFPLRQVPLFPRRLDLLSVDPHVGDHPTPPVLLWPILGLF